MNSAASLILIPLGAIYSAVTRARLAAYGRGLLSVARLPVPVISVGNLTTGGTGKTPLVEWVCRALAREGKKVCVLTRGYGRANAKTQVVVSNGAALLAGERQAGDEPFLLAKNLLGTAAVICNPNRVAAGQWAIEKLNTEMFVLDDGFQHLRLARDLNLVTIDATNPWGGGTLLPYGRLREPATGLARADCVIITRAEQADNLTSLKKAVQQLVGGAPIFSSRMLTSRIRTIDGNDENSAPAVSQPAGAFCGVGNPEAFFHHLEREGYDLAFTRTFADHHKYRQSELDNLVEEAKARGVRSLITTAKDAIKLSTFKLRLPCYVLEIQISIDEEDLLIEIMRDAIAESPLRK